MSSTRALLVLSILTWAAGCDPSDPCDPGYYQEHGTCLRERTAVDAGADAGPSEDDDAGEQADAEAPPADPFEGIGDECATAEDCPDHLICGGEMLPICTLANCDLDDPNACPVDWTCFDVSSFSDDPNAPPTICINF